MVKSKLEQEIIDALEAVARDHGIDVVDVEIVGATKAPCVRVRLDRLDGESISLEDVTAQSAWVSDCVGQLDLSSPGMARPLRRPSDFARFVGEPVELTTTAMQGRRSYKGTIAQATDTQVTLELEGEDPATISYDEVKKCVLKPVFDFKPKKEEK